MTPSEYLLALFDRKTEIMQRVKTTGEILPGDVETMILPPAAWEASEIMWMARHAREEHEYRAQRFLDLY